MRPTRFPRTGSTWSALVALQFFGATTTASTGTGHVPTETIFAAEPGASILFIVLLGLCCTVTGDSLLRRVRAESERWSRSGSACAGVLGVLVILSLATVGLALVLHSFLLHVVSRPIRRPRPIPGERVPAPRPSGPPGPSPRRM